MSCLGETSFGRAECGFALLGLIAEIDLSSALPEASASSSFALVSIHSTCFVLKNCFALQLGA